ncbi:MAG: transposase family protein, partial [Cyanobacteria bacterium J06659_2]
HEDLQQLIQQAELKHRDLQAERERSENRLIAKGGGRKPSLSVPEQVVLTLTYLRQHPTLQILGIMFDVSESTAHTIFHYWLDIL